MEERISNILNFWFEGITKSTTVKLDSLFVKRWFGSDPAFEDGIRKNFEGDILRARKGKYEAWQDSVKGRLAMVILMDQCSRIIYRGRAEAFENDLKALEWAFMSIRDGKDKKLSVIERTFLYMPLIHSENLKIQEKSLDIYCTLAKDAEDNDEKNLDYCEYVLDIANKHLEIIQQFGRFPQRNQILNRRSTPQELDFLKEPEAALHS